MSEIVKKIRAELTALDLEIGLFGGPLSRLPDSIKPMYRDMVLRRKHLRQELARIAGATNV